MADIETVLADVSYIMAVNDSKAGKKGISFTRKKLTLPDPTIHIALREILNGKCELTFEALFLQPIAFKLMVDYAETDVIAGSGLVFYNRILEFEKETNMDKRVILAKDIADNCMMPDILTKQMKTHKKTYDHVMERMYKNDFDLNLFELFTEPVLQHAKENLHMRFFDSKMFTRFCQWKALELDFKPTLSDFNVHRKLGRGGYGEVYGCRKIDTGRVYAMKVSHKKRIKIKKGEALAINERNILCKLNNPFIVGLHYAFQTPDQLILILDLAEGGDLHYYLDNKGPLNENMLKFYCAEMVLGLSHMHIQHIIYRDMKPSNVLLDMEGHVKISDLGLAHDIKYNYPSSSVGTQGYMAPEVIHKGVKYGFAVDWFSLGCTIYKLATGHGPFSPKDAKDRDAVIHNTLKVDPTYPDTMSPTLISLLKGFLKKDATKRLGYGSKGIEDIKKQPFFDSINWLLAARSSLVPPFKPSCGEVNAAEVDDIGSFDSAETHGVKLTSEDQEKYDGYELCMPLKWQEEILETVFNGVTECANKSEGKKKSVGVSDMFEDIEKNCILQGYVEKQAALIGWNKKYCRIYENRIELNEGPTSNTKSILIAVDNIFEIKELSLKGQTRIEIIQRENKQSIIIRPELEIVSPVWLRAFKKICQAKIQTKDAESIMGKKIVYNRHTSALGGIELVDQDHDSARLHPKIASLGRSHSDNEQC